MIEQIENTIEEEIRKRHESGENTISRGTHGEKELTDNPRVADLVFSFNNSDLINALRTRGNFIALQKFDKAQE